MSITEKEIAMRSLFSRRLGSLIESHGIQQNDLAMKIGVSESTVGKWILKKAMPRMGTIQKLADYFGVPKSYFLEESIAAPHNAAAAPVAPRCPLACTPREKDLVQKYRVLSPDGKATVDAVVDVQYKASSPHLKEEGEIS